MYQIYIVDDEEVVRQGLKIILDWHRLGFEICGEAADGLSAYQGILTTRPEVVLVDIHMPKLHGLELVKRLRAAHYDGRIIVLSGYSEFKYAQEAIMYGVDYYMTKPIDEDELKEAIQNIHQLLDARKLQKQSNEFYQKKARHKIIEEMIKYPDWRDENPEISFEELGMVSHSYQVLILNRFSEDQDVYRDFLKGLDVSPKNKDIEWFQEDGYDILLLQGDQIINRFAAYQGQSRNLTDQSYYIAVGRVVMDAGAIHESYSDAWVTKRRSFFSSEKRFIESIEPGPTPSKSSVMPSLPNSKEVAKTFFEQVVVQKQDDCCGFLEKIFGYIEAENADVNAIKNDLAGIYITISQEFQSEYPHIHFDFMNNNEIINVILSKHYLFEIIDLICSEVASWMVLTGDVGDDDIIERIVQYVRQHCTEDLKVKNIAQKFGYNRCYLGKIFTHKVGVNFTEYLHGLRIDRAKELLENTSLKMYEIAKMVGYAKADSFQVKFKDFVGCTPTEYRVDKKTS